MKIVNAITVSRDVYYMEKALFKVHWRYGLMWYLGTFTGLRISDLLKLRPYDIAELLWVEEQKTKKIRCIYLPLALLADIEEYIQHYRLAPLEYLFFSSGSRRNKPISRQWAHRIIARTARYNGLHSVGAHSMRKIYACDLYRSTGHLESVQRALGHKNISTTFLYIREILERRWGDMA